MAGQREDDDLGELGAVGALEGGDEEDGGGWLRAIEGDARFDGRGVGGTAGEVLGFAFDVQLVFAEGVAQVNGHAESAVDGIGAGEGGIIDRPGEFSFVQVLRGVEK